MKGKDEKNGNSQEEHGKDKDKRGRGHKMVGAGESPMREKGDDYRELKRVEEEGGMNIPKGQNGRMKGVI